MAKTYGSVGFNAGSFGAVKFDFPAEILFEYAQQARQQRQYLWENGWDQVFLNWVMDLSRTKKVSFSQLMSESVLGAPTAGNLAYDVTDADLREAFGAYGEVASASVITDKFSNESKGFGFVEMPNGGEANNAIKALNEKPLKGRNMRINEAKPREARPPRRNAW
jgi:hypothetical protein